MRQLNASVTSVNDLTELERSAMYELYASFYDATSQSLFDTDLDNKTHAVLIHDQTKQLRGFTSVARYLHSHNDTACQVVFSGDTIIHQDFWGEQVLPETWIELTGKFKAEHNSLPLYWFLIVKGYRTYRYLSLFSKKYYPHYKVPTPTAMKQLMNELARERFNEHYQASTGLIQFPESKGHLKAGLSGISDKALSRRDVQFFLAQNPGYANGDELVCITELSLDNLSRRACVYFARGLRQC